MKILATLAALLCVAASSQAQSDSRAALVHEIVRVHGIDQIVHDAKAATSVQADQVINRTLDQVRTAYPEAPDEMWAAMRTAAGEFARTVAESWSPEEAILVWEEQFIVDFSEEELRQILAAAKTPLGQKQIAAGKRAGSGLQKFLLERTNKTVEEAAAQYIAEIQKIVATAVSPVSP